MMPLLRRLVKSLLLLSVLPAALAQNGTAGLSLSANGTTEIVLYRGWPLLVEARALLEDGGTAQLQWPSPVRLTILSAGKAANWPLKFIGNPDSLVTVTGEISVGAIWLLSADATSALNTGDYTMLAEHPTAAASRLVLLTVSDEPAELSKDQGSLKAQLRSRYEELTGTREAALQILSDWLETTPDDIEILAQQADLLYDMERFADALNSAELALQAFDDQFPDAKEPAFDLLRRIRMLRAQFAGPAKSSVRK
jgi:hypothetical protein